MRIARSISDREPIAWDEELARAPELLGTLWHLRRLHTLASVHESAASEGAIGAAALLDRAANEEGDERAPGLPTWGPLEILESLGRGGFGRVYRAYDPLLQREVALKLWRRGRGTDALLAEARALARVRHPNLPVVHGADDHDGWLGMWTDLVRGRTLEELIATQGPLGAREAALVGVEICRALQAVHEAGLVHRDIKTSNVMRDESGRVVLLDFGLATEREPRDGAARAAGTPSSMAPELLQGGAATPASDLYAVGVLLYRLVSRAFPYEGSTAAEIAARQERGESVPLGERRLELPATFVGVVEHALAHAPESRPKSALALEQALRESLGSPPIAPDVRAPSGAEPEVSPLPHFLTRFIGRDGELSQCHEAIQSHRLVTLLGPGGSGKTRLAVRQAERIADTGMGVAFADLASLHEPATVEPEVRRALDAWRASGGSAASLARTIGSAALLLVLDNCEHLLDTVAPLATSLLASCPRLRLLATSRAPLRVPGEQALAVPPLALPPAAAGASIESVAAFEAVQLFVARARLVRPDFQLTAHNAEAVAEVCRRADGLPLAIELAAARTRAMTPEEIRDRLVESPRLLARGGFSTTARHASLETAIRWTYDSLADDSRTLMDGLAVFSGTWSLPAAARVCMDGAPELWALDAITSLIEQSLVTLAPPCLGATRYRLLDTLRAFAQDRLRASGRLDELEWRHFDYFLTLAEEAEPRLWGPEQALWSERLDADHANLQAALAWARSRPERAIDHVRLAGALARFWTERGHLATGREALTAALVPAGREADSPAAARALLGASTLAIYQSDHTQARVWGEGALRLYRRLEDPAGIARTLVTLGIVAHEVSDYAAAETCYRESLERFRTIGDRRGEAQVLNNLGAITWRQDRWNEARALHREALVHAEPARDPGLRSLALTNLGLVEQRLGHVTEAAGCVAEALALVREHRLMRHAASALEVAAAVLAERRESARAARLYAAARRYREQVGNRQEPAWRRVHEPAMTAAARDLGAERLETESRVGQALSLTQAIDEAARGLALVV